MELKPSWLIVMCNICGSMNIELDNQNKVVIASQSGKTPISDVIELINKAVFFSADYQCNEILLT